MVKSQTIITMMEKLAPKRLAEAWDNVGLQVGSFQAEVDKVLVALDLTDEVLTEAVHLGAQMIITHHPFIFSALKKVDYDTPQGKRIKRIIQHDLTVYAAHTNLDITDGGVNDILAEKIGLLDTTVLQITGVDREEKPYGLGRIGYLAEAIPCCLFLEQIKNALGTNTLRFVGNYEGMIQKVAICGGSGGSLIGAAVAKGADVFLTGDLKYHEAMDAQDVGLHLIDAGHDLTEQIMVPILVDYLQKELKNKVEVIGLVKQTGSIFQIV